MNHFARHAVRFIVLLLATLPFQLAARAAETEIIQIKIYQIKDKDQNPGWIDFWNYLPTLHRAA
jgi:hypothetical protein